MRSTRPREEEEEAPEDSEEEEEEAEPTREDVRGTSEGREDLRMIFLREFVRAAEGCSAAEPPAEAPGSEGGGNTIRRGAEGRTGAHKGHRRE